MNRDDFGKLLERQYQAELELNMTKGREYAVDTDVLSNFKNLANELGLRPEQVCFVYLKKHIDSISSYCKHGETRSNETMESRISDARLYLALLGALIQEKEII